MKNLTDVLTQIGSAKLIAVTKQQNIATIEKAIHAGQLAFGENYIQEALPKISALKKYKNIEWHFIGVIQANKTRAIAEHFDWVQTVDRIKIAERLNAQRPAHLPPMQICIELNISDDKNKSGVTLKNLPDLIGCIKKLPRLHWRGFMTMVTQDFAACREIFLQWQEKGYAIDTLSMGASNDFVEAIAQGSTMVRIGTKIFGERHT